jgi:hypothetical protein
MNNVYDELTPDSLKYYKDKKKLYEDSKNDKIADEQFNKTAK